MTHVLYLIWAWGIQISCLKFIPTTFAPPGGPVGGGLGENGKNQHDTSYIPNFGMGNPKFESKMKSDLPLPLFPPRKGRKTIPEAPLGVGEALKST